MDIYCQERVSDSTGWHSHPCRNKAKAERGGASYCNMHDPERVEARRAARFADHQAAYDAKLTRRANRLAKLADEVVACTDKAAALSLVREISWISRG